MSEIPVDLDGKPLVNALGQVYKGLMPSIDDLLAAKEPLTDAQVDQAMTWMKSLPAPGEEYAGPRLRGELKITGVLPTQTLPDFSEMPWLSSWKFIRVQWTRQGEKWRYDASYTVLT